MSKALKVWFETANTWLTVVFIVLMVVVFGLTALTIVGIITMVWVVMLIFAVPVFLWELIKRPN